MKMYLISDNVDTLTGMRLAGVEGEVVHGRKETKQAVEKILEDKDQAGNYQLYYGNDTNFTEEQSVIVTYKTAGKNQKLSFEIPEIIDDIKLNRKRPLLVEIPDRHGSGRQPNFITNYINEAIGIKL